MKKIITIIENIVEMFAIAFTVVFFLVMIIIECTYFGVD